MGPATDSAAPPFARLAGHPLRWRLLAELATSDLRVRELVERLDQPQNLVSYHLRLLRDGGLVTAARSSHDRRDTYYHLDLDRCAHGLAATGVALHPALRMAVQPPEQTTGAGARVLFVCTGNSARSPIAEALLRHRTAGRIAVASAGTSPRDRIHPEAVRVLLDRFGLDIRDHAPRSVDEVAGSGRGGFDRVVTLCDKARAHLPDRAGWRRAHWSVPDPAAAPGRGQHADFASTAVDIDARVRHLIPTLDTRRSSP